jgi:hypothetical protein
MPSKRITRAELVFRRLKASDPKTTYAGLLAWANTKGFKDGWVAHKFKAIYGKWPKPRERVLPEEPSSDLATWLGNERRNYGARLARKDAKDQAAIKAQSATVLERIEAILDEIEANPLGRHHDLGDYGEALDEVCRLERKMARNCADRARHEPK